MQGGWFTQTNASASNFPCDTPDYYMMYTQPLYYSHFLNATDVAAGFDANGQYYCDENAGKGFCSVGA